MAAQVALDTTGLKRTRNSLLLGTAIFAGALVGSSGGALAQSPTTDPIIFPNAFPTFACNVNFPAVTQLACGAFSSTKQSVHPEAQATAVGINTTASGSNSTSLGISNTASGQSS